MITSWRSSDGRRWALRPADDDSVHALVQALAIPPALARVLVARDHDAGSARDLLDDQAIVEHDAHPMLGLDPAVVRIGVAIEQGEHVRLVTDYDVDGTMSCLILHATLDRLVQRAGKGTGARVTYHVPDRFTEGYGLSAMAVDRAADDGVALLITADIGVREHANVARARGKGIDVIVVDHHLPAGESVPPDALAVLCPPQSGCPYPNRSLAACGVAYKLAGALLEGDPQRDAILRSLRKLVAIGTVADLVDLSGAENRSLVRQGLHALNHDRHSVGLAALLRVAVTEGDPVTSQTLAWRVGPRINAAGRIEDANAVVRLLRERDPTRAREQAEALDRVNRERQGIQTELFERALAAVPDPLPAFVVVDGPEAEGWHRGVVGIVASKLRERIDRPVAVISHIGGGRASGSVRSVPGVHAVYALDACADLFHRHGGHAAAAGFTIDIEKIPELRARLSAWVDAHLGEGSSGTVEPVDVTLEGGMLTASLVRAFGLLEPCGKGIEAPRIALVGTPTDVQIRTGKHLFFNVGGTPCTWWNAAEHAQELGNAEVVIGQAELDTWRGANRPRLRVEAVATRMP